MSATTPNAPAPGPVPRPGVEPPTATGLVAELQRLGAPAWYLDAVTQPQSSRFITAADGTPLHLAQWNEHACDKPVLLLLHGYRANTHAWDAVAPVFTTRFRVAALDWPGMGCSGHRVAYGGAAEAGSVLPAVVAALGGGPVTLVAHSFGGSAAVHAACRWPGLFDRAIVVDSLIPVPGIDPPPQGQAVGPRRAYPSREEILRRFRLLPEQPCPPWALRHMAHHSVREVAEGWTWRFDPALPARALGFETWDAWRALQVPVAFVVCEHSQVARSAQRLRALAQAHGRRQPWAMVADAHHHAMLDQPLALSEVLLGLLDGTS